MWVFWNHRTKPICEKDSSEPSTKAICTILRHRTILLLMEINSGVFTQIPIIELSNVLLDFLHLQHSFLGLKLILLR